MRRVILGLATLVVACGGGQARVVVGPSSGVGAAPNVAASPEVAVTAPAAPDVDLREARAAWVGGTGVPFDGVAEGLAWPALAKAVHRKPGDHAPLTIAVGRDVPMATVLRAVWTLRDADVRVQTPDAAGGAVHVLDLRPKPETPSGAGCHLAVFVGSGGELRIAAPGGPRTLPPPSAADALARALAEERSRCTLRYVAFGAERDDAPWGSVFDVARAVDRDRSAGDARYVLAEPVRQNKAPR